MVNGHVIYNVANPCELLGLKVSMDEDGVNKITGKRPGPLDQGGVLELGGEPGEDGGEQEEEFLHWGEEREE